jgi:hypothetical protein
MSNSSKVSSKDFWRDTLAPILGMQDRKGVISLSLDLRFDSDVIVRTEEFVLSALQRPQRQIIQKDRFATYEPGDMWWAEPAGLAEWGDDAERAHKTYELVEQ